MEKQKRSFIDFITDVPAAVGGRSSRDPLEQSKSGLWLGLRHRLGVVSFAGETGASAHSPYETLLNLVADYDPSGLSVIFELLIESRFTFPLLNPLNGEHYLHLLKEICLKNEQPVSLDDDASLARVALLSCRNWANSQLREFAQRLLRLDSFCRRKSLSVGTRPFCVDLGIGHVGDGFSVLAACITADGETDTALKFAEQFADILIVEDVAADECDESFDCRLSKHCFARNDKHCEIIVWQPSVGRFVCSEREANVANKKLKLTHLNGSLSDQLLKFITQQILQSHHRLIDCSKRIKLTSIDALDNVARIPVGEIKVPVMTPADSARMTKTDLVNFFRELLQQRDQLVRIMSIRRLERSLNWSSTTSPAGELIHVEDLWRELGHAYAAQSDDKQQCKLPELAAQHMLDGFSFELLDGQASDLNVKWIDAVLRALHHSLSSTGNNKLFVLSVIGAQSSGKSTLLNTMFGVRMRTDVGRCTRGISMQLVPVRGRKEYDYVLVLDSEGLRSPEAYKVDEGSSGRARDNKIATLGILLADATIFLSPGENDAAAKEVLPVVMMACNRSSVVEQSGGRPGSFMFFAYNNIDTTQRGMLGSIFQTLERNLREAFEVITTQSNIDKDMGSSFFRRFRLYAADGGSASDVRVLGKCKMSCEPPDDVPDPRFGESLVEFREYIHERVTGTGVWTSRTPLELAIFVQGVDQCLRSADFNDIEIAQFVEKMAFDQMNAEYQSCEQKLIAVYQSDCKKVSDQLWQKPSGRQLLDPGFIAEKLKNGAIEKELDGAMRNHIQDLDRKFRQIVGRKGRKKWRAFFEQRCALFLQSQRNVWRSKVLRNQDALVSFCRKAQELKSELGKLARDLAFSVNPDDFDRSATLFDEKFQCALKIFAEKLGKEKSLPSLELTNYAMTKIQPELRGYFRSVLSKMRKMSERWSTLQANLLKALHEAFEAEVLDLTFKKVKEQTWFYKIKWMQLGKDPILAEEMNVNQTAELIRILTQPKAPFALVLHSLVADIAHSVLCNDICWREFTNTVASEIERASAGKLSLLDKIFSENTDQDDYGDGEFHEAHRKQLSSAINSQSGPSDLKALSRRVAELAVQQLLEKNSIRATAVSWTDGRQKSVKITKETINQLLLCSSEKDEVLSLVDLNNLDSLKFVRGKHQFELLNLLKLHCVHVTSNAANCENLTSTESFVLALVQHFTGQYLFLDCLDHSKLAFAHPNLDEGRWNAFRMRLESLDFSNCVKPSNLDEIIDEVRQLFLDCRRQPAESAVYVTCLGLPSRNWTHCNGHIEKCTHARFIFYDEATKRYEAIAQLQDVYEDTDFFFSALLKIYEAVVREFFKEKFDSCGTDTEASEKLADKYREDIVKVGETFDSWDEVFHRWNIANRLRTVGLNARSCRAEIGEEELCELLRRTVAACFKSESEDAWGRRKRASEEALYRATVQSLASLEEIERLQRELTELASQASTGDGNVCAARASLAWKMFLLDAASSTEMLSDRQLAVERERHPLFHEKNPVQLAKRLFAYAYPKGDSNKWQIIESYAKRPAGLSSVMKELRGVLRSVIGEEIKCSKRNGVVKVSGGLISVKNIELPAISDVKEIQIDASRAIHLDADLNIPGVSVSLSAPSIHSHGRRTINTSGTDGPELAKDKADDGRGPGASGSHGADGNDGQDAGHVAIKCRNLTGQLKIMANGGRGSRGQDGGNGKKGADGRDGKDAEFENSTSKTAHVWFLPTSLFDFSADERRVPGSEGTRGQDGGSGGDAGRGGRGGRAGNVSIDAPGDGLIEREAADGADGDAGHPGQPGEGGSGGRDGRAAVVTRRHVARLSLWLVIGCVFHYEYDWARCPRAVERQTDGKRGREGERAADAHARREASRASHQQQTVTDHWSDQHDAALLAGIESERDAARAAEEERRRIDERRQQTGAEMSRQQERSDRDEARRTEQSQLLNKELESHRRLAAKNAEIPEERVTVTARQNLRRLLKCDGTANKATVDCSDNGHSLLIRSGGGIPNWTGLLDAIQTPSEISRTRIDRLTQELVLIRIDARHSERVESFIRKFANQTEPLINGLQLLVDCFRFDESKKFADCSFGELLKFTEHLIRLNSAQDFATFDWEKNNFVSNSVGRMAIDSRLFAVVSQQLKKRRIVKSSVLSLMERVWPRGELSSQADRNRWMERVVQLLTALEHQPLADHFEVERLLNVLIRYRLQLPEDLSNVNKIAAPCDREKLMIVMKHCAVSLGELDAIAKHAAKELDREMFSLAHFTFTEHFCSAKWREIDLLPFCQQNQDIERLFSQFKRMTNSPFGVSSFTKRLATIHKAIEYFREEKWDSTKLSEWMQREIKLLEPWTNNTAENTNITELVRQLKEPSSSDDALLRLLHQLDSATLDPERICELASVLFSHTASSTNDEIVRLHWSCLKSEFTRNWFDSFIKFSMESHKMACQLNNSQRDSVDSLKVLRAKFSLWVACLSPSDAADNWKSVEAAENSKDKRLIQSDLKTAGKKIRQVVVEQVNLLSESVKVGHNEDIVKLIDACFQVKTENESALVAVMELIQLYLDLSQQRRIEIARDKIDEWRNIACKANELRPEFVASAVQVINTLETSSSSEDDDRARHREIYERIVRRREEILGEYAESVRWMATFVHILSDPVAKLNGPTLTRVTVDHVRHWNWLDIKYRDQLLKSVAGITRVLVTKRKKDAVIASDWNDVMGQLFNIFCPDMNDASRVEIAASLAGHVFEQMEKTPGANNWSSAKKWIEHFRWLRDVQLVHLFKTAHIEILLTLVAYCRLCYGAALASDLAKRKVSNLPPHMIDYSFRAAFDRSKRSYFFLLTATCRNLDATDHWRLELSAVQRTLEFFLQLALQSDRLFWDDVTIDNELLKDVTANESGLNQDGLSIIQKLLSEKNKSNRQAFVERWLSQTSCYDTEERLAKMKKAYCMNDGAYTRDSDFFTMAGLDVLTGEENAYARLIENDELILKEVIASGASPSDYLARLESMAADCITNRLRGCFQSTDHQFARLNALLEASVHAKKKQNELIDWLTWLKQIVIPSLESYAANQGPTLKSVASFLDDAARLPLVLGLRAARQYRPRHWLSAIACLSIERLLHESIESKSIGVIDGIIKKLVEWSTRTDSEVVPSVLRSLYTKIVEKLSDADTSAKMEYMLESVVGALETVDPSTLDGRTLMRFADSTLDDWPKVVRFARLSVEWSPEMATRLVSLFPIEHDDRTLQCLLDALPFEREEAADVLGKVLKNLSRFPWLRDELASLMASSADNSKRRKWLERASRSEKQIEQEMEMASRRDLTVDEILDALNQDPLPIKQFSNNSMRDRIKESVNDVRNRHGAVTQSFTSDDIIKWSLEVKENNSKWSVEEFLAVACRAIELNKRYLPRDVQLVAVLAFVLPRSGTATNRQMAQISTGEGKTLITALIAIHHVLKHWNTKGRRIDIVTSSPVLAEANVAEIEWLYSAFGVKVTNNCDEQCCKNDTLKRERYNSDVIYGDLSNFMRDVLVTEYFDRDITRNTTAGAIVVDEVDSMLLDKGENVLYISHDLPEMHDLLNLFVDIWAAVNGPHPPEPQEVEEFVRPRIHALVPRCLKHFSERHLSTWVASAWKARHVLVQDDAYKVDDVRDGKGTQIVIMDKETGVEQLSTEWSDGLQQFLQLKHGVKWTPPSLRAIYMSNMTYFTQFAGSLYGLSGTLGSAAECDLLSKLYGVEFFKLPRSKRRFCVQDEPIVAGTKHQWLDGILRRVERVIRDKRAVLVLCENIEAANSVRNHLHGARITCETYVSSLDDKFKERQQNDVIPGSVLIATNLAGRGTDLKLSEELADNGGLHLVITFVPGNVRVEDQAEGRTARAGQRGSYQFVVQGNSSFFDPLEQLAEMKEDRDRNERQRLTLLLDESVPKALLEERLFRRFFSECCQRPMDRVYRQCLMNRWAVFTRQCLMNRWALWLDEQATLIEKACDPDVEAEVMQRFESFVIDVNLKQGDRLLLAEIPSELVALARLSPKKRAIQLCERVKEIEPNWCESALVELARLTLEKAEHQEKKEAKVHLKQARQLIEKRTSDLAGCAKIVSECLEKLKQQNPGDEKTFANTSFASQMNNLIGLWRVHSSAIDNLLGVPLEQALANHFKEEHIAELLEFISKSEFSGYTRREHYSSKVEVSYCNASKQMQVFIGEKQVSWPPFLAHCREQLMKVIKKRKLANKRDIERAIAETEEKFWKKIVQEGYVSKDATSCSYDVLKQKPEVDLQTLPADLKKLEKIVTDWLKSHEGQDLDLARPALGLQDESEWKLFAQWLKDRGLVESHTRLEHRILKAIPDVSENPQAEMCGSSLEKWAIVLASWFSRGDESVFKPDFKERAAKLARQCRDYFVDFGVMKPLKIAFSFLPRSRDEIQKRLGEIRKCFESMSGISCFAHKMLDRGTREKSTEVFADSFMAAVHDHIGQLKALEMVESSFSDLRDTVRKPDDPVFELRDECEEMESRHVDRVVKVKEKIPFDWGIAWVALIGVAQLVGAIAVPFLASSLIGEGISDLMYAFECYRSPGSFSWKAYGKQKAQSLALAVATLGLGAVKLVAAGGKSLRNAARLIKCFNGTIKGWIKMGKSVVMRCVDAITSSLVGAAVSKFLNWLKKLLIEKVLERVKSIIFELFKTPFENMTNILKSLVTEFVKLGKSVEVAIQKATDLMENDSTDEETWFSRLRSNASSVVNGMLNIFEGSTSALQGLQSSFGDSYASKAPTGDTGAINAARDGGTVAKAIKLGAAVVDYGKQAIHIAKELEKLHTATKLCTHAVDRITSRTTRLQQELNSVRRERLSTANKDPAFKQRQLESSEEEMIDEFVRRVPGEMQTDILNHVIDTIQSTWLEPKIQAYAQKKASQLTEKIAVKVGLLPPPPPSDSQTGGGEKPKSYDEMVDGIGGGDPAGPTEVQNAADALGINIKIVDETGEYTKGTDSESFSVHSQGNPYNDAKEVTLRFTANADGGKHFELIDKDGNVLASGVPDPTQPANRCLYEALSKACGKGADETINLCKSYAKTNERARYMYGVGVDEAFGHLKAGARKTNNKDRREPIIRKIDQKEKKCDFMPKNFSDKSDLGEDLHELMDKIDVDKLQGVGRGTIYQTKRWRLDLQGTFKKDGVLYANYQIQLGGDEYYKKKKGEKTTVACVLVPVGQTFTTEHFRKALYSSLKEQAIFEMFYE